MFAFFICILQCIIPSFSVWSWTCISHTYECVFTEKCFRNYGALVMKPINRFPSFYLLIDCLTSLFSCCENCGVSRFVSLYRKQNQIKGWFHREKLTSFPTVVLFDIFQTLQWFHCPFCSNTIRANQRKRKLRPLGGSTDRNRSLLPHRAFFVSCKLPVLKRLWTPTDSKGAVLTWGKGKDVLNLTGHTRLWSCQFTKKQTERSSDPTSTGVTGGNHRRKTYRSVKLRMSVSPAPLQAPYWQ